MVESAADDFRCGRVALIGRPNVGKSTLLNRLVGTKLSITSKKAQTTRQRLSGIVTTAAAQLIFVDTPGFQTAHRSRLNERMNRAVTQSLAGVDAIVVVMEGGRTLAADRAVIALLPAGAQVVVALNKIDLQPDRGILLPQMAALAPLFPFAALVPVSAERGSGVDQLCSALAALLPRAAAAYAADALTDRDERFFAAEFIREKIFRLLGDELPYASAVTIDRYEQEGDLRRIGATVYVDRPNHKAILLGRGGLKMKEIASAARTDMESLFGGTVYLEIWVRVKRGWADDDAQLARLGY